MQFFKRNLFGILSVAIGSWLLSGNIINISEVKEYHQFRNKIGEYIAVEETLEPSLMGGGLKISMIFLSILLIPVVLAIIHKRRKGDDSVLYLAIAIVIINFLVFPYLLTLLNNSKGF